MKETELRFRQVHLDFHTSGDIAGIGSEFKAEEFVNTLDKARVDSISCFARCHHGWLYYDSKEFLERIHPNLANKELLKEQIEACHQKDIKVPIYITVQWDLYTARRHPEWRVVEANGKLQGTAPYEAGFYQSLCVNTPYRDFLKKQTKEVLEIFDTDGLFFDIVGMKDCSCKYCLEGMKQKGLNPADKEQRMEYAKEMLDEFKIDMSNFVREYNPDCTIFYNAGHVGPYIHESQSSYSHFELESLPSGGWGYLHFPVSIRYARNLGLDCLGMTGKFHTSWGDFHSFKNKEALEFECFQMLAHNAKCSIGDQLAPDGKISKEVYDLIGSVYSQVEKKEPWCKGAKAITDIAVFSPEEFTGERVPVAAAGVVRMLQEASHQFDIVDSRSDLDNYKVLILPDNITISDKLKLKLEEYINNGGKLIASGFSGLDEDKKEFKLSNLGVKLAKEQTIATDGKLAAGRTIGIGNYADYILPEGEIGKNIPSTEHVMYMKGLEVEAEGAEVLADIYLSYFDRSWEHFCSHRQTPSAGKKAGPAIVKKDNCIYFAHPIFTQYYKNAPKWCKQLVLNALDMLLKEPVLQHEGPSTMLTTVNEQKNENRWVVHLLHYIPERRSQDIDIIEDIIPLYNVKLSLKTEKTVKKLSCVPKGEELSFEEKDGRIEFVVPEIKGHQMIEILY